jgi:hypothetical protein
MKPLLSYFSTLSIILPFLAGWARFRTIRQIWWPLLVVLSAGLLIEINSIFNVWFTGRDKTAFSNIYTFLEITLTIILFRKWGHTLQNKSAFCTVLLLITSVWVTDNLFLGRIRMFSPYSLIPMYICMVMLSVNEINWMIINVRGNLFRQPVFLVCLALLMLFSFFVLVEIFYFYAPDSTVRQNIYKIQQYINIIYNCLLTLSFLCIPKKADFIQPLYSRPVS